MASSSPPSSPSPFKSSNLSDFVHKVATIAYKRRPHSSKHLHHSRHSRRPDDDDDFTSDASSSGRATPSRPRSWETTTSSTPLIPDPSILAVKVRVMETLLTNIFAAISALKSCYARLQAAHSPYDPVKLETADKAVIAELRRLSDLKHSYAERDAILSGQSMDHSPALDAGRSSPKDLAMIKSYEDIIDNFQVEIQQKNAEVENLKDMLAESTLRREKLDRRVKRLEQTIARDAGALTPLISDDPSSPPVELLQSAVLRASEASSSFTKLLISLMSAAQWDLNAASDSIEPGIRYSRRSHRKHAFESYVCQQMWNGFENEDFYISGSLSSVIDPESHRRQCFDDFLDMKTVDPLELIGTNPDCLFGKFCHKKFLQLVHPKMETSFFGNFEHRKQITGGSHPNSQFYQNFLRLAKAIWLVHRLAFSFNPKVSIYQVRRGTPFTPVCMESVVSGMDVDQQSSVPAKVGFSVMPGFRVERVMVKCQVYLEAPETTREISS